MNEMTENQLGEIEAEAPDAPEIEAPEAEAEAPEAAEAPPAHDPELVAEAKRWGWKAPEEWVGDKPPGYIDDPKRYLDMPSTIRRRFDAQHQEIERIKAATAQALRRQRETMEAEHRRERERILAEQRAAVETGDVEKWEKLERDRAKLDAGSAQEPSGPQVDPLVADYRERNEWARDPVKWAAAIQAVDAAMRTPGVSLKSTAEQLAFAERAVRETYPHWFSAPAQRAPQPQRVDGGGLAPAKPRAKSWESVPAEHRGDLQGLISSGVFKDKAEAAKYYWEDNS